MAELRVKSTGTLKLFESDNTSSVTIASPASLGGDRTVTLPDADVTLVSGTMSTGFAVADITGQTALGAEPADTDEFVLSDAGVLKRVDYSYIKGGTNTPAFSAYKGTITGIADSTTTDAVCDSERFDTDGTYDTSTGRFTPGVIGRYGFYITSRINQALTSTRFQVLLGKNGSNATDAIGNIEGEASGTGTGSYPQVNGFAITDCDDVADYFTMRLWQDSGSDATFYSNNFMGFRIIL